MRRGHYRETDAHTVYLLAKHRNWIVEALLKESAQVIDEFVQYNYVASTKREFLKPRNLQYFFAAKKSDKEIFVHHQILDQIDLSELEYGKRRRLFLTHFDPVNVVPKKVIETATIWDRILVQNSRTKETILSACKNISEEKIEVFYGAINRKVYFPLSAFDVSPYILLVGDCKPRKNPQLAAAVIKACPDLQFLIHGKNWERYFPVNDRKQFPNLTYIPFDRNKNPKLVREAKLLLSLSTIEGGPIPVLEALASGTRVLATDTGFARDLIGEQQGHILSGLPSIPEVVNLLRQEMLERKREGKDLLFGRYTWTELALKIFGN